MSPQNKRALIWIVGIVIVLSGLSYLYKDRLMPSEETPVEVTPNAD